MTIQFNMIQSIGLAVIFLLVGKSVKNNIPLFSKYAIPSPVIGGLIFSIVHMILRQSNIAVFEFDSTLQTFFQTMFFCTVGFNASLKMLKVGGKKILIFLLIATVLATLQNVLAVGLAEFIGINPLLALLTASPSLTGGHGTSAAVAPSIEALGYPEALTVALTAATFGLISGSILGSPMANRLIIKNNLVNKKPLHRFAPAQPPGGELRRHRQRLRASVLLLHQSNCAARRFSRHGTSVPVQLFALDQRFPCCHRLARPLGGDPALHIQGQKPAALPGGDPLCPGWLNRCVTAPVTLHRQAPVRKIQGDPPKFRALLQQCLLGGLQIRLCWCRARL